MPGIFGLAFLGDLWHYCGTEKSLKQTIPAFFPAWSLPAVFCLSGRSLGYENEKHLRRVI
jgi:hypothetical protein